MKASARLTEPATSPFTEAIQVASVSDTLRVRLLSMPHAKHAPRIASAGQMPAKCASPDQLKHDSPGHDRQHAQRNAAVAVLLEREPRQQRRKHPFRIEQQRCARCRHPGQPQHQQQRPDDPAGHNRPRKPRHFSARQPDRLGLADMAVQSKADAGTQIQQPGQQPRADRIQQQFRQRRAGPEQDRRTQRSRHAGLAQAIHHFHQTHSSIAGIQHRSTKRRAPEIRRTFPIHP